MPAGVDDHGFRQARRRWQARLRRRGQVQATGIGLTPVPPLIVDVPTAQALSEFWRAAATPSARRRRHVATTALAAGTVMTGLSLYQLGVIRKLPELPLPGFDAERVDASAQAYQLLSSPDATLGVVSYAVTAALAGLGGEEPPVALSALLAAKAAVDLGWAAKLTLDQATKHRAACSWCLLATSLTVAGFVPAAEELRAAWRNRSAAPSS